MDGDDAKEEENLLAHDVKGRELNPVKVKRRCTDCLWNLPFGISGCLCCVITWHSIHVGNIVAFFQLPDFMGHMCGGPTRRDKAFLFFCMEAASEHVFDEKNKSLDHAFPICVSECPDSFNTSSRCYQGGPVTSSDAWAWVQNYPSQSLAGIICRPHAEFALSLHESYAVAIETAPPNLGILLFVRNWPIFALSGCMSIMLSIIYIFMLSKCARTLIWTSFLLVVLVSGMLCTFFALQFQYGSFESVAGHGRGDIDDLLRSMSTGVICLVNLCYIIHPEQSLESAGRVMERACKCIMSTPSLILMPLFLAIQRSLLLILWLYVCANYITSGKLVDADQEHAIMRTISYGNNADWEYDLQVRVSYQIYLAIFTFCLLWANEVFTSSAVFVMYFTGQVWQLITNMTKEHIRCRTVRGYLLLWRYHSGSVIFAGFLQLFLAPLHLTLGFFEDSCQGPIGFILESFCSCVLDFYRNHVGMLKRDALQNVSLFSMPFLEAAEHINEKHSGLQDVRVLNTQTKIFQVGGLGLAGLLGWVTAAQRLQMDPYHDQDQDEYVADPFKYCIVGCAVAVWVALPFMKIFDVVSDAVIYSLFVQDMAKPAPPELIDEVLTRTCGWSRPLSTIRNLAHCNCGTQRNLLPVNRPAQTPQRPDFVTQSAPRQATSHPFAQSVSVPAHD